MTSLDAAGVIVAPEQDPRQADVDEVMRMLAEAARTGLVTLPSLVTAELCVLGGYRQALFDETVLYEWANLPGQTRVAFGAEAIQNLIQRGLLTPLDPADAIRPAKPDGDADPGPELANPHRMHPGLGTIFVARSRPTWLAVCSIAATNHTGPRMFGLGTDDPLAAAVMELPQHSGADEDNGITARPGTLADIYDYTLASATKAMDLLAGWALLPVPDFDGAGEPLPRAVDFYRPMADGALSRIRVSVHGDGLSGRATVSGAADPAASTAPAIDADADADADLDLDRTALATLLHRLIRQAV